MTLFSYFLLIIATAILVKPFIGNAFKIAIIGLEALLALEGNIIIITIIIPQKAKNVWKLFIQMNFKFFTNRIILFQIWCDMVFAVNQFKNMFFNLLETFSYSNSAKI